MSDEDLTFSAPAPDALAVIQADVREPSRLSASTLMAAEKCLLAAYLARQTGNPSGEGAILGSHFHDIAAQVGFNAQILGRETFTADEVERTALRVLQRPEEPRPLSRAGLEEVLGMARNWAQVAHFPINADRYEVELAVRHELAGQVLSGRIDLLAVDGVTAEIDDYKSGRYVPSQREVEEEHPQLPTYAWHVAQQEPEVETFILREVYVRSGAIREVILGRDELRRHERWLTTTAMRFRRAWSVRGFQPTPGRHCKYCPNPAACPLPEWARPESINTREQAQAQLAAIAVEESRLKTRKKAVKAWLNSDDGEERIEVGDGVAAYMNVTEPSELDRRAAEAAGLDLARFTRTRTSKRLRIEGV